jgi:hypothetical protein
MAFDSTTRGKLQRLVTACRNLLTDEFDEQLQSIYGVYAEDGRVLELDKLPNLDDDERMTGALLRERIAHLQSGLTDSKTPLNKAVQRVLREQAFTVLNRFAALRMAEERELVLQCVGDGLNSKGFQVFENVASPDLGSQYERYCIFLGCLFDELSLDLGVLFDRYSPFGLLFPREPKLKEVLQLLNDPELKSLWREDETIGWIYQYFNDPAERKLMREAAAPRNSRELAVRNQFFTPRYVVEFLIDNTLGRLWYEMTKGRTELARCCRYLLRRPNEVFLGNPNVISNLDAAASWVRVVILTADFSRMPEDPPVGELSDFGLAIDGYAEMERRGRSWDDFIANFYNPQAEAAEKTGRPWKGDAFELWCALFAYQREVLRNGYFGDTDRSTDDQTLCHLWPVLRRALQDPPADLSQEEMLRQPQFVPHRPIKDPREIRLLDPACGSMHFGLYAFDLFETIYAEAHQAHVEVGTEALRGSSGCGVLDAVSDGASAFSREVPRLIVERNIHGIDIDPRAVQIAGLSLWLRAQRAWQQAGVKPADRPHITRSNLVCAEPMPGEKELLREFVEQQFPADERAAFAFLLEKVFDQMTLAGESGSLLRVEDEIRTAIADARTLAQGQSAPRQTQLFVGDEPSGQTDFDLRGLNDEQFWQKAEQRIYAALEAYAEQAENGGGFQRRLFAADAAQGFAFIDLCRKLYEVVVMNPPFGESSVLWKSAFEDFYPNTRHNLYAAFVERGISRLTSTGLLGAITSRTGFFLTRFERWRQTLVERAPPAVLADLGYDVLDSALVETAAYCLQRNTTTPGLFMRLLAANSKDATLLRCVSAVQVGERNELTYVVDARSFQLVPGIPFAYWIGSTIRSLFASVPSFETKTRRACITNPAGDDKRYFRCHWEVDPALLGKDIRWTPIARGGRYNPFYSDIVQVVDWDPPEQTYRGFLGTVHRPLSKPASLEYFFKPGVTWPLRGARFSAQVVPAGCIFSVAGKFATSDNPEELPVLLGLMNSSVFDFLLRLFGGETRQQFEVGLINKVPVPIIDEKFASQISRAALRAVKIKRRLDSVNESSHAFLIPAVLTMPGERSEDRAAAWQSHEHDAVSEVAAIHQEIDDLAFALYGITKDDRKAIEAGALSGSEESKDETDDQDVDETSTTSSEFSAETVSYAFGCVFGRWDIRCATGERLTPELPEPFAPLPVCPPGMLLGDDSLPLSPEEGRRLRAEGHYPLDVAWDGILVDDAENLLDLEHHVRAALAVLWAEVNASSSRAEELEHEACALLYAETLREWFRRPAGFFADHLKRYSKSRRQAPIYWPLSTASGRYTLWLYYHRLNAQTLYTCVTNFVKPRLDTVTADIEGLQARAQTGGTARERAELQELRDFQAELQELHDELLRVAQLPWKPNLNDGVLITASPLWKLFRLPKWQKDLKACWEELAAGDYDWAHLALTIWPDRVRAACKTDRSLAIAHGLEDLCEVETPKPKAKRAKKPGKEKPAETLDFQ